MRTVPIVFLIDDDVGFASLIQTLAESVGVMVRRFDSAAQFRRQFDHQVAGCVIVDLGKPELGGLELLNDTAKTAVTQPLIALTDTAAVNSVVHAARNGALAFLQKNQMTRNEILDSIQLALQQNEVDREQFKLRAQIQQRFDQLNETEERILEFLLAGNEITMIAKQLETSRRTVEKHRTNLMRKLEVDSFVELVALAVENNKHSSSRS